MSPFGTGQNDLDRLAAELGRAVGWPKEQPKTDRELLKELRDRLRAKREDAERRHA